MNEDELPKVIQLSQKIQTENKQESTPTDVPGQSEVAHLPCSNEQDVEAQVRISADGYSPYNRSVFLSNETTEILLERKAMLTLTSTPTTTFTPMPTPQPTATVTPPSASTYPCIAQIYSENGANTLNISIRTNPTSQNSAKLKSFSSGDTVYVHEKYSATDIWYLIFTETGNQLGWISSQYLTSSCLN